MMTYLVLQSFGRENEYKRAILTTLSFFAHINIPLIHVKTLLFTDKPDYFTKHFAELPVEYVLLTQEKIKSMRGRIDFLHRMKIAVIEEAFSMSSGNLIYTDSDTFFIADPDSLLKQLSEKRAYMHLLEYPFIQETEDKTQTYKDFYLLINSQSFKLSNGSEIKVTANHNSWNAGVMFFHQSHARFIPDVYALTEQFYPLSKSHASEQYAFSVIMQENTILKPCDTVIYHYWYRIKKLITDDFLDGKVTELWAENILSKKLDDVKKWCTELPKIYTKHNLTMRDNAIQAFCNKEYINGYMWAMKALYQKPLNNGSFLKDVVYHTKKMLAINEK